MKRFLILLSFFFAITYSLVAVETSVQIYNGGPTFFCDGKPFAIPCFETYRPETRYFKQFADMGTRLFSFNTNAAACDYGHSKPTWLDIDVWDYSGIDERVSFVLDANPEALIMPRINLGTPRWWLVQNPGELEILDNGETLYDEPNRNPTLPKDRAFPSLASKKWRNDIGNSLRKLIQHIQNSEYADNIFGYFLAGMDTEEWYHWSSGSDQLAGYSKHTRLAFQQWLKKKYKTNKKLQQAWNKPSITFDRVTVPTRDERYDSASGTLRDPSQKMHVIDFYLFYNDIIPETIDHFAKALKEETNNKKVVGAFYGYMYEFGGDPEYGHNALARYNQSKYLDFIFVTASYYNRALASGGDYMRSPAYSVQLNGKLWYHDNDTCSFMAPKVWGVDNKAPEEYPDTIKHHFSMLGYTDTAQKSIWMYRRSLGFTLCHDMYESFFDLHGGYFDHPELMKEVKTINRVVEKSAHHDRSSISEILVISDESSCSYTKFRNSLLNQSLLNTQWALIKIGAPCDHLLIDDLDKIDPSRYKLVIFLNNYNVTQSQRRLIQKRLQNNNRYLLWCYAPGYFQESQQSEEFMNELTGITIKSSNNNQNFTPQIQIVSTNTIVSGLTKTIVGPNLKGIDRFYIDDDRAIVLGRHPKTKDTTFAMKDMGTWKSIYSITPVLSPDIYRAIAQKAGVHLFNEANDTFYANASYICLHAREAGERNISLPYSADVYDAMTDLRLFENVRNFECEFKTGETRIFRFSRIEALR